MASNVPPIKRKRRRPDPNSVLPAGKDPAWRSEGWSPSPDAASVVDYIADVILAHTRDSIMAGQSPRGGVQKGLDPKGTQGRQAKAGKRPNARGWNGSRTGFPLRIRRGKILGATVRASGPVQLGGTAPKAQAAFASKARVVIQPGVKHRRFAAKDLAKGVEYLVVDGEMGALIQVALEVWTEACIAGETPEANPAERDAEKVK